MKNRIRKGAGVFVHERAYIAGEVSLGDGANIWCGACIRGDIAPVAIGKNTNVQDNATVHVGSGCPAVIGDNVTVGHNAIVHGCTVGSNTLVGMAAVLLDGAVFGSPYRLVRTVTEADLAAIAENAAGYLRLAEAYAEENAAGKL